MRELPSHHRRQSVRNVANVLRAALWFFLVRPTIRDNPRRRSIALAAVGFIAGLDVVPRLQPVN